MEFTPNIPAGFDAFWQEKTSSALSAPLDFSLTPSDKVSPDGRAVQILTFRGISGEELQGWVVVTPGAVSEPGFLWVPPYSRWSMLPNEYGTRPGFASLSFNFFGESAFHQETYTPTRGYFADGIESPETWIFGRMYQNAVIALRVLASLPGVDSSRLASCGMSQGGGISIWLGAFCPLVKAVCADMPFLGGIGELFAKASVHRYPLKEIGDWVGDDAGRKAQFLETLRWFDTIHMASRCSVPTLLTLGTKDPAVRPWQVHEIFGALPVVKKLVELDWGHDWHPSMVERNLDWMTQNLGQAS